MQPDGKTVLESFTFGRQSDAPYLCLADYVRPRDSGRTDYLCMFVTTIGTGVRALAEEWKNKGDYLRSHILQVLALEGAEAFAELLHAKIRQMWGIGDRAGAVAQGSRAGALSRQALLVRLSRVPAPGRPGAVVPRCSKSKRMRSACSLTEGFMMDPESAVSAVVFHHPEAKYFSLSPADIERLEASSSASSKRRANRLARKFHQSCLLEMRAMVRAAVASEAALRRRATSTVSALSCG